MVTVVAVGLGPADARFVSPAVRDLLNTASSARLRTTRHPAAAAFAHVASFDERYDRAEGFDELYQGIADELVALASADPTSTVVYAVPGSPLVAEHTVTLLRARDDVVVEVIPAVSFVDLACAALEIDPVAVGLRLGDALDLPERLAGGGPMLLAQAHSPSVLAEIAVRVDVDLADDPVRAVVLHHLGLADQRVVELALVDLASFTDADHLTSVYLPSLRAAGDAVEDLVTLMARLRADCPWDRVQTHASLARYLVEETYESIDAIASLSAALDAEALSAPAHAGDASTVGDAAAHAAEELGDLLFQIVFHAHLSSEEGLFDLRGVADGVRDKLVSRHPHVFGDAQADTPDAVAARWEDLKRDEKGRGSIMDGIPTALPALSLMSKVRRKSLAAGLAMPTRDDLVDAVHRATAALPDTGALPDDASIGNDPGATELLGDALASLCDLARLVGVDPEQALRARAHRLADEVRGLEAEGGYRADADPASSVDASEPPVARS